MYIYAHIQREVIDFYGFGAYAFCTSAGFCPDGYRTCALCLMGILPCFEQSRVIVLSFSYLEKLMPKYQSFVWLCTFNNNSLAKMLRKKKSQVILFNDNVWKCRVQTWLKHEEKNIIIIIVRISVHCRTRVYIHV